MADDLYKITNWSRKPGVYELEAAHALDEDQPAFEQIQLESLTRGETGEKLRQRWKSFLQRFRKLKPQKTLVDRQPVWVPLLDLYVPATGKATVKYEQREAAQSGPELKILGSGFGGSLSTTLSEAVSFNAEDTGKSFQMKILVTAIQYASDEGDELVRLEPELSSGPPEFQILDLPAPPAPAGLDSPLWQILHKVNLVNTSKGTYTWQRDKVIEASWKVDAGIPIPEALGIKLNWTLKVAGSEAFSVKYEIPYGKSYVFYQPSDQIMLAPYCAANNSQA